MSSGWSIDAFGAMFEGYLEDRGEEGPMEMGGRGKRGRRAGVRRVALLLDLSKAMGRGVMRGVAKFNRENGGRWAMSFFPFEVAKVEGGMPEWLKGWKGHGVLGCVDSVEMAELLMRSGLAVVNVGGKVQEFSRVMSGELALGKTVVEHFRDRGLREFACCDVDAGRREAFWDAARQVGRCAVFDWGQKDEGEDLWRGAGKTVWARGQERLSAWLRNLPRPVGVFAGDDATGLRVLEACGRCGSVVPNDVALMTAGNDEGLCELAVPRMTSVDLNFEKMGMEGAGMLEQMMRTRKGVAGMVRVEPKGVVVRGSTDVVVSGDESVDRAVRFIRERGGNGIGVPEVVAHVGVGRLVMQRRMKRVLGRTIREEIERARVGRVKEMLLRPEMTIKQIARVTGFSSVQYMTRVFHEAVGETPGKWRGGR